MEQAPQEIKVLIMCGGKGTRMWPISNVSHPKQFEGLLGKISMFRQTVERVLKAFKPEDVYISTGQGFVEYLHQQALEIPEQNLILEPTTRDNLGAVALATAIIHKRHPESVMVILWGADHLVQKEDQFLDAIKTAALIAQERKCIVFVDAKPTYPSVHNGWMELGQKVSGLNSFDVYELVRQVEKPDEATAQQFFDSGSYAIHVGYMAVKASVMRDYYRQLAPETDAVTQKIEPAIDTDQFQQVLNREYPTYPKDSIDYGLLEKLPSRSQLDLVSDFGWVDVGTWELLYQGLPKDQNGNVAIGNVHLMDTKNSLIIGKENGVVAVIGLNGMIVVGTESGTLCCPLNEAGKVKQLYKELYE